MYPTHFYTHVYFRRSMQIIITCKTWYPIALNVQAKKDYDVILKNLDEQNKLTVCSVTCRPSTSAFTSYFHRITLKMLNDITGVAKQSDAKSHIFLFFSKEPYHTQKIYLIVLTSSHFLIHILLHSWISSVLAS